MNRYNSPDNYRSEARMVSTWAQGGREACVGGLGDLIAEALWSCRWGVGPVGGLRAAQWNVVGVQARGQGGEFHATGLANNLWATLGARCRACIRLAWLTGV